MTGDKTAPADTPCDDLAGAADTVRLPGTHHFNGQYDDVGKVVVAFIDKTVGEAPPLSVLQKRAGSLAGRLSGAGEGRLRLLWIAATLVGGIVVGWTIRRLMKRTA